MNSHLERLATGRLLVATPSTQDPNFNRTAVLLLDYDQTGAMGVVINRAGNIDVESVLDQWCDVSILPQVLFDGGPLQPGAIIGLARRAAAHPAAEGWTPVFERVGIVDLHMNPKDFGDLDGVRMFSGYANWTSGQLEVEVMEGAWFVCDANPMDPFSTVPDRLWRAVLRRQPGEAAWFATFPSDPALN